MPTHETQDPEARRRHMAELGRRSGEARRKKAQAVEELLRRTRTERGMELVITDPAIIAKVAAIVAAGGGGASDAA